MSALPSQLYEVINCLIASLAIMAVAIFLRYLGLVVAAHGHLRGLTRESAAIAIAVTMVGESLTRGWTFWARYAEATQRDVYWMNDWPWAATPALGALVTALGILCVIRVFSPGIWGARAWAVCAGLAVAITTGFQIFR